MTASKKPTAKASRPAQSRKPRGSVPTALSEALPTALLPTLLPALRQLIDASRRAVTVAVNMAQTQLYWRVGARIRAETLGEARAPYGKEIVATLSRQLTIDYGRGFEEKNLRRMIQFAECFPDENIVATQRRQLQVSRHSIALKAKA